MARGGAVTAAERRRFSMVYSSQEMPLFAARSRKGDCVPSQIAAAYMNKKHTATHAEKVLKMMRMMLVPVTAIELAGLIKDLDRIEISRRLSGLEKAGLVEKCGVKEHSDLKYSLWRTK